LNTPALVSKSADFCGEIEDKEQNSNKLYELLKMSVSTKSDK